MYWQDRDAEPVWTLDDRAEGITTHCKAIVTWQEHFARVQNFCKPSTVFCWHFGHFRPCSSLTTFPVEDLDDSLQLLRTQKSLIIVYCLRRLNHDRLVCETSLARHGNGWHSRWCSRRFGWLLLGVVCAFGAKTFIAVDESSSVKAPEQVLSWSSKLEAKELVFYCHCRLCRYQLLRVVPHLCSSA